jgi:hypothetical protein
MGLPTGGLFKASSFGGLRELTFMKHYSIEGKKDSISVVIIVMVIVMINILTIIALLSPPQFDFLKENAKVSCQGIRFFYTGTSFYRDYVQMKMIYMFHQTDYNSEISPPTGLIPFNRYDCEDFAHAINCLSKYYAQKVDFYDIKWKDLITGENGYHIGFCFIADERQVCDYEY